MAVKKEYVVACCGHFVGMHGEDGCEDGWQWDSEGRHTREGCSCEMRAPKGWR